MAVLIVAEHSQGQLSPATLSTITAGLQITEQVDVLVAGQDCQQVVDQIKKIQGVSKILLAQEAHLANPLAEDMATLLQSVASDYSHILAPATTFGKNTMPRLAALLDVAMIADITKVVDDKTFIRPIYAGNAFATVRSQDSIIIITVRTTAFAETPHSDHEAAVSVLNFVSTNSQSEFVELSASASDRPELTSAKIIISGGRGLQSAENFKLIEKLADRLNAAVGASRAAVDAGFVPNDYQVGQTGKVVAPQLYIAIGISGAIQHLAGIKDSKIIVAINKDANAPIFEVADYGLVADFFEILPELEEELTKLGY